MIIADTGFVVAVLVSSDKHHVGCAAAYQQYTDIYLPQTVLAEVGYLLTKSGGNRLAAAFARALPQSRYIPVALDTADFVRTADLLDKYADSRLDFVDATVIAIAERFNILSILTIDRRDFSIVQPAHTPYFTLLP
jgi:uncharacterized protein